MHNCMCFVAFWPQADYCGAVSMCLFLASYILLFAFCNFKFCSEILQNSKDGIILCWIPNAFSYLHNVLTICCHFYLAFYYWPVSELVLSLSKCTGIHSVHLWICIYANTESASANFIMIDFYFVSILLFR